MDTILRDLRFTWRLARRQLWTTAAVIASVAIGVGANTAVTSVLDTVLLNPLGIRNADRIVAATVHINKLKMEGAETSGAEFRDLEGMPDDFPAITATEHRDWTLAAGQPSRVVGLAVTPEFFNVFEQRPSLGRYLDGSDPNEIFLSYSLWQSLFGGNRSALDRKLLLDGKPYRVVGVAARDFHFPPKVQAWVPLILAPGRFKRGMNMDLSLFARLKNGVSLNQAQQRVNGAVRNLRATPEGAELRKLDYGIDVRPLAWFIAGDLRRPLLLLWWAALILLIAACANVAGLLLARAGNRRKEMAIRISAGGNRMQILRQLLTESVVLAVLGGAAGMLVAAVGVQILEHATLPYQQMLSLVRLNGRLLLYGLSLALASSILFGIVPAIELIREQHIGAMARARRKWFQNIYIVGQVSAAMFLLVVAGLLLKTLRAVESLQPGFDAQDLTTAFIIKPAANQNAFYDRLLAGLRSEPGVQSAALGFSLPFGGDAPTSLFDIKGRHHLPGEPEWHAEAYQVSPGYFETLHVPLLRGRVISHFDTADSPVVCVIDAGLARRFFPNEDPIGQEIRMYNGGARIVGVVSTVRDATLENASRPVVYYALAQIPYFPEVGIVVRSTVPAAPLIRNAVRMANPGVPVFDIKTMDERIGSSLATRSAIAWLVTVFSTIGILLAALGIHAVIAQVVGERTAEIGIRMALGARSSDIFVRYLIQGLRLSFAGIAIGISAAIGCGEWLRSFLYKVEPIDPATLILGALGALAVSGVAVLAPSWRASHIDPQSALRAE
ncbi:MAG TPA: ABC transporter permease [Bryobacteraceae bacterium]|jgi:predicted permease|nr:ABC transporter permease [Bryobacteraceae bacterium]